MRVQQHSAFLTSLLTDVVAGRVVPAGMQRPYVWSKEDVEGLFDSILKGYPIGSFVYWQPDGKADLSQLAKVRLGPILSNPSGASWAPTQLLMDGQNRLASIAWSFLEGNPPSTVYSDAEHKTWLDGSSLVVDHATRSICFVPKEEAEVGLRLPAWTISATASPDLHKKAMRLIRQRQSDTWAECDDEAVDSFFSFWDECNRAFQSARVTLTVIQDATPDEARTAFLRVCKVGVPMSAEDFDKAVNWGRRAAYHPDDQALEP